MIYIIFDTNIWLYLANGLDTATNNYFQKHHFELLAKLEEFTEKGEILILINDVIIEEWKRNKASAYEQIKKLEQRENSLLNEFKRKVRGKEKHYENIGKIQQEIQDIRVQIKQNKEHIEAVEKFLFTACKKIDISDTVKLQIFDLSIKKQPPFHNKKNNTADAAILFSAAEFLKDKLTFSETSAIFVSNNFTDFTNNIDKEIFHPDLNKLLPRIDLRYQTYLPHALKLSEETISEMKEFYRKQAYYDSISFACQSTFCEGKEDFTRFGYMDKKANLKFASDEINATQFDLFTGKVKERRKHTQVNYGRCAFCGTLHLDCPLCKEVICVEDQDKSFSCAECESKFEFKAYDGEASTETLIYLDMEGDEKLH
jgi:hypothetical protein